MQRKLPPLNALKTFESAARLSSFSEAANELCVTHGAVSQQIRTLEDYFGRKLFTRVPGKVVVNPAGRTLLAVATESLDLIEEVAAQINQTNKVETLTVNVTTTFASHWLLPRLHDFHTKHPNITVRLSPTAIPPNDLGAEVDIAIRWEASDIDGVIMEPLFDVDSFVACAPSLLQGSLPLKQPQDLLAHNLIHDDDGQAWTALLQKLAVNGADLGKGSFYADSGLALQAAVEGGGVIVAGSVLAEQDLVAGRLVIPFNSIIPHRKSYYIFSPKRFSTLPKIESFRAWIQEQVVAYQNNLTDYRKYML